MKTSIAGLLLAVLILGLSGCKTLVGCQTPKSYGKDASIRPLEVPAGLDAPDTRGALKIPELNEPEKPAVAGKCLDEPPRYSDKAPVAEPAKPAS